MKTYEELVAENEQLKKDNVILARAAKRYKERAEREEALADLLGGDLRAALYGESFR